MANDSGIAESYDHLYLGRDVFCLARQASISTKNLLAQEGEILLETFTAAKPLINNANFAIQRQAALSSLDIHAIDEPIRDVIKALNRVSFCFTIQSCFGHFVFGKRTDPRNLELLPQRKVPDSIEYRIAYVALCVHKSAPAARFLNELSDIQKINPQYIQYGCAHWFWERHVNSYVIQVEPERHSDKDSIRINYREAKHIEELKRDVFIHIHSLTESYLD